MFDHLTARLSSAIERLRGRGRITDANVAETLREARIALLEADVDAPREVVFAAWTDAEQAAQWWGPQGFTTISCEMDVRVGGGYRACMRSPEGTRHCRRGTYREIVPPTRLVFTYAWEDADGNPGHETLVTVTFADAER